LRQATTAPWPSDVLQALGNFRQGHLIPAPPPFSYYGDPNDPLPPLADPEETARPTADSGSREFDFIELPPFEYGVITSQTCDIAEEGTPEQPFVQVAPVVTLTDSEDAAPQYLALLDPPDLPEGRYAADLRMEVPVEKTVLVGTRPIEGFPDEAGYLDFARQLGTRRERPAVATELVAAVAQTLKRRKTNSRGVKNLMRDEIHSVRLSIDEGTRMEPAIARVHVIGKRVISDASREKLDNWWQEAYKEAEAAGIKLLPNEYHDATRMDIGVVDRTIKLNL
jgi:hypothetical protein